ncbi:MAG TPA: hypothetical protein VLA12_01425 [Planctomycetaceae bacterium]|nr:hypothetical protein [Planctomycetaceae bacterium]
MIRRFAVRMLTGALIVTASVANLSAADPAAKQDIVETAVSAGSF